MSIVRKCSKCSTTYRRDGRECPGCPEPRVRGRVGTMTRRGVYHADFLPPVPEPKPPEIDTYQPGFADRLTMRQKARFIQEGWLEPVEAEWRKRFRIRLLKYELTASQWADLVISCKSCCMICRDQHSPLDLHIDHDHYSMRVRGLLCSRCNTGIGLLRIDGPNAERNAQSLKNYLVRTQSTRQGV